MPMRFLLLAAALTAAAACSSDTDGDGAVGETEPTASAEPSAETSAVAQPEDEAAEAAEDAEDATTMPDDGGGEVVLGEQVGAVTIDGDPLDVMPPRISVTDTSNDPSIGQMAPELRGTDFTGAPVEVLADGTPRVIMFVAHWCPHCRREIPAVKSLIEAGAVPEGLELVVVSTAVRDGESNYPPQQWLQDEGWSDPILRDSEQFEALFAFGAGGFPFSVYLDADHRVVARSAGELPADILQQLWLATVDA